MHGHQHAFMAAGGNAYWAYVENGALQAAGNLDTAERGLDDGRLCINTCFDVRCCTI